MKESGIMPVKKKSDKKTASPSDENPSEGSVTFESAMEELEGIVANLEEDSLTLDEALASFERGIALLRTCDTHLNDVRGKITELLKGENGEFTRKILGTSLESFLNEENEDD